MSNREMKRTRRGLRRGLAGLAALVVTGTSFLLTAPIAEAKVTGVKASVIGADVIRLTWSKVSNAKSYQVQWSTKTSFSSSTTKTKKVKDPVEVANAFTSATGLKVNTTYYLRVQACKDAAGDCATGQVAQSWSSRVSGKTKYIYKTKPTNLVANNISSSSVELSFTNVSGAPGYRIRYYNKTDGAKYVWSQVEELTLTGLRKNTQYWISASVQQPAFGSGTKSYTPYVRMGSESKELKVKTSNYSIPAPTGVRISDQNHNSVVVSWVAPPGVEEVQQVTPMNLPIELEPEPVETVPAASEPPVPSEPPTTTEPSATPTGDPTPSVEQPSAEPSVTDSPVPDGEPTDVEQLTGLQPSALKPQYLYRVQYSVNKNMSKASTKDTTNTNLTLTGLKSNTNYYVRVYVVDATTKAQKSDRSAYQIAKTRVPGGTLKGQVSGLSGSQWKDVVVSVYSNTSPYEMVKQVDVKSNGSYTARVRPGKYRIKVSYLGTGGLTSAWVKAGTAAGVQTRAQGTLYEISKAGAQVDLAGVNLGKGATLTGWVQNKKGAKLNSVDVAVLTAQTSAREIVSVQRTGSNGGSGSFSLSGLGEGYHWVRFVKSGYKTLSVRIRVQNAKVTQLMISNVTRPVTGNPVLTMSN